ncbi:hypothetical protein GCM10017608_07310 [Agromyces luteolus]|nr:hypothetical protein GCM10017608_07310 [Agromyces luteolus]
MADQADLSRRMLTQIELGQANPSLVTIDRIAAALGTDFAGLALPESPGDAPASVQVWRGEGSSEALLLAATTPADTELWRWTLAPGARYDAQPDKAGAQEIHHVIAGELALVTREASRTLVAGDTTVIFSDQPYSYVNPGETDVVFFRVVSGA